MSSSSRVGWRAFVLALLAPCAPAWAGELDEPALLAQYFASPLAIAERDASEARLRAEATPVPAANPRLEARHEAAKGPAGATTDALSASVPLSVSQLGHGRTARARGKAATARLELALLTGACDLRTDAVELWAAAEQEAVTVAGHDRLSRLVDTLDALATAGEASGYDRDRAALALASHRLELAAAEGDVAAARTELAAHLSTTVDHVDLAPLPAIGEAPTSESLVDHPELRAFTAEVEAAEQARRTARGASLPEVALSGGVRWDALPDGTARAQGYEIAGGVELPLLDRGQKGRRDAQATLLEAEARRDRRASELLATALAAHRRATALAEIEPLSADPMAVWDGATERYADGESSLDELLQTAEAVETAQRTTIERERRLRHAHLQRACAVGRFDTPSLQSILEEAQP